MNARLRLQMIRKQKNLSQRRVAREIGVSQGTYWKIEHGKMKFTEDHIIALCRFYNLSADYLIGLTDEI